MKDCQEIVTLLQEAHAHFNELYAGKVLQNPIIGIYPKGKKQAFGWFFGDKWQNTEQSEIPMHEICITAEHLDRPLEDILETLLHEMAHQYNHEADIVDCNKQGRHNKQFKKTAEDIFFLACEKTNKGYNLTSLMDKSKQDIATFCQSKNLDSTQPLNLKRQVPPPKETKPGQKHKSIQVSEDDYEKFKNWREENGLLPKQAFAQLLSMVVESTVSSEENGDALSISIRSGELGGGVEENGENSGVLDEEVA